MHYAGSSRRTPSAPRWTACKRSAAWRCWRAPASSCSPAAARARSTRPRRRTCPSGPHPAELTMMRTRMSPGCSSYPTTHGAPARRTVPRTAPPVWPLPAEKPLICSKMMQLRNYPNNNYFSFFLYSLTTVVYHHFAFYIRILLD